MRRRATVKLLHMSRDEGGFRMVPVVVGVNFGTSDSVVAIADRSGQVQVRRFDTQIVAVEAYRSALLPFREGRPPNMEQLIVLSPFLTVVDQPSETLGSLVHRCFSSG
jgi:hypothetical protein